jgi:transcription antitermination factor NusG
MSDRPIKTSLMQGYVFVRADRLSDLGRLRDVREVCYILGSWNGDRFVPAEIRPDWIDAMEHAGPKIVGKKIPFQKGRRVRLILGKISDMISECEGVDKKGRVLVRVDLLGKSQTVAVDPEHVELAD